MTIQLKSKSDIERKIPYDLTYTGNLKKQNKQTKTTSSYRQTDDCHRWGLGMGRMGEGGQKIQSSSYKISHGEIMYNVVTIVNNTVLHI